MTKPTTQISNRTGPFLLTLLMVLTLLPLTATRADLLISDQDKKELDQTQKLMNSGEFGECAKLALTVPMLLAGISFAAIPTDPSSPVPLQPGTFTTLGEQLENIGLQMKNPDISKILQKLGKQVRLQEGKRPFTLTPAMKADMQQVKDWTKANCIPKDDSSVPSSTADLAAIGSAQAATPTAIGPAQAATPVAKVATDTQTTFHQLSANDAAIVLAAKGIQLGNTPGPAAIQVIFDPNAPYGAKLYQQLAKLHPELPVRWVPVAYITKKSTALVSLLIHSQQPRQALDENQRSYDFAHSHGGIIPPARTPAPLPAVQDRLLKSLSKWSPATPTTVFRDSDGRWLETPGSGVMVINSILARAAKN